MPKRIFAVLYVSVMGLTRCYKTTVFLTFIFAVFVLNLFCGCILLHKPIYGVAVLQKRMEAILEYYCGLNLVIVVINTSSADTK